MARFHRRGRNGKELFYRNDDKMMAVGIESEPGFSPGIPALLFEGRYLSGLAVREPHSGYDWQFDTINWFDRLVV